MAARSLDRRLHVGTPPPPSTSPSTTTPLQPLYRFPASCPPALSHPRTLALSALRCAALRALPHLSCVLTACLPACQLPRLLLRLRPLTRATLSASCNATTTFSNHHRFYRARALTLPFRRQHGRQDDAVQAGGAGRRRRGQDGSDHPGS